MKSSFISKLSSLFVYTPRQQYNFSLSDASCKDENTSNNNSTNTSNEKIYESINVNLEFLKVKYNTLINSDIIIREFKLMAKNKEYSAFLVYIDGMIDSKMINDFILKPLMLRNKSNTFEKSDSEISVAVAGNISVKRIKKFSLSDYIYNCLIPQNSIKIQNKFTEIVSDINSGNCGLFIDTLNVAFSIEVKGFKARAVSEPNNEVVVHRFTGSFCRNNSY